MAKSLNAYIYFSQKIYFLAAMEADQNTGHGDSKIINIYDGDRLVEMACYEHWSNFVSQ